MELYERIAEVCHEVNRVFCHSVGDESQVPWSEASDWQKLSAINGVRFLHTNPKATPEQQHESWLMQKQNEGWVYGDVKDPFLKQHPCMLPYDELPADQKVKDKLFQAVARTMLTQYEQDARLPNSGEG